MDRRERPVERPTYLSKGERQISFPLGRTALLVIDPVNDFLSEGGAAYSETKVTLKLHHVVDHLREAIAGARQRGVPVIYAPMAFTAEDYASEELQRRSAINRFMFEKKMFLAGTWGADFHPQLRPRDEDIVLLPHKSIDVFETDLPAHLERLGITHLVIAGMTANLCCESTGRHAMEKGFDVTFLSDAIGSADLPSYEAAVHINYPMIANGVITVSEFLAALEVPGKDTVAVRRGDTVVGSDHLKIGEVRDVVVAAANGFAPHVVVSRGLVRRALYIPLEAVVRRSDEAIFVNVPRIMVGKMPWKEPPEREDLGDKSGQPEATVDRLYRSRSPTAYEPTAGAPR